MPAKTWSRADAGDSAPSSLDRLLAPRSVALAGVASAPGSLGGIVLENLERFAFPGPIHIVHPTRTEVRGRPAVASFADLPYGIDCAVLAIPMAGVLDAVRQCAARGVGGVVIFSAGFAELGPEGRALQEEIAQIARDAGMVLEGPNCLGHVNYVDGAPLTFAVTHPRPLRGPGVAVASQSGAMASVLRAALHGRELDVSLSVSTGNEAANSLEDFIAYLLETPETKVVAVIAEHIRDPRRFLALARRARTLGKPIAMLHPGASQGAAKAAETHTGAMTGDHAVMRALSADAGVLLAPTLEALVDVCDILMRCPVAPRGGVAVLGESGAFKALVLDYAETLRLPLPQPEGAAAAALDALAPGFIVASNPLDLTAQALADPSLYDRAIESLLADPACGSLLISIILTSAEMAARKTPPLIEAIKRWSKTHAVVFAMLGEDAPAPPEIVAAVREAGAPFLRSPERALRVLASMSDWRFTADAPTPDPIAAPPLPRGVIPEHAAKDALEAAGLPIAPRRLVVDKTAALAAAEALGWPVALKIQSKALSHKSDVGGVVLGLNDALALWEGWDRLRRNVAAAAPDVETDGVLVEPMAARGLEMILGGRRDPHWGPVVVIGLGGVMAEVMHDLRILPASLSHARVLEELGRLKGAALLGAFRGRPPRDLDAVAQAVATVGRFLRAHPEVEELDVNPLMVFEDGKGVLALDALIRCR